jgi:hypothetical protein
MTLGNSISTVARKAYARRQRRRVSMESLLLAAAGDPEGF